MEWWGEPSWAPWNGLREPSPTTELSIVLQPEVARVLCAWWKNNLCLVDERSACKYLVRAGDWETRGRFRDLGMLGRVWAGFGQGGWEQPSLTEKAQLGLCCLGRGHLTAQR